MQELLAKTIGPVNPKTVDTVNKVLLGLLPVLIAGIGYSLYKFRKNSRLELEDDVQESQVE
jgi:hypothetical protein